MKAKNIILLLFSLLFYAWGEPRFVLLMILSITMNYGMGLLIAHLRFSVFTRKTLLALGITLNITVLFFFKYLGFFEQIINSLTAMFHISSAELTIHTFVLPLGISFYTFQSLSYLIDVYREPAMLQRNILDLGLYISFFPQLIAGPIVRYYDICEQIKRRSHNLDVFVKGIERFIIGLAKKVLLANTLAEVVDGVLKLPFEDIPSVYLLLVIVSGMLQLFYDFSGYSDMAIGLARMFGFKIMENFDYPLAATNSADFWKRWHISLSSWFRDYLYIPLGGSRKGTIRQIVNTLIVFTLVGLWHGASYNFVFFGFAAGLALLLEIPIAAKINKFCATKNKVIMLFKKILAHVYCNSLRVILFMFFRLNINDSFLFYSSLFNLRRNVSAPLDVLFLTDTRFYIFLILAILFAFPWWRKLRFPSNMPTVLVKCTVLLGLFLMSFGTLTSDAYNPFIYFRF